VAQAQLAYKLYREAFSGPRWESLAARGAASQRPLWASTSTKNPEYPDLLYVDTLIGPETVNTMPDATVEAFLDHGVVARTVDADLDGAAAVLDVLRRAPAVADRQGRQPAMSSVLERLESRDTSLWPDGNVSADRLGWLDIHERMAGEAADLATWAAGIDAERIVLLGMGGSSLGPEVLRAAIGSDRLTVLDTTDPATVLGTPLGDSFFVVSSKSGGTLEVRALLAHSWERVPHGERYAAVTDPGTALDDLATERGFSRVFRNPPDIGGRYSVLSYFGLVPAALLGYDIAGLCEAAASVDRGAAVELGLAMGEAARQGRDKLNVVSPEPFAAFGLWVEQLVAESTGKRGRGIIPIPSTAVDPGDDRYHVALEMEDPVELGAEFLRWEMATAAAGHVLEVDPFDEPNVAESKKNTDEVLSDLPLSPPESAEPSQVSKWLDQVVRPGDYVSLQAYLPYGCESDLERLRVQLSRGLDGVAASAGFGPRFLHSTGQLHKGGPDSVVAVQIVPRRPSAELPVPGFGYDFGTLIAAQAVGDHRSLLAHDRRVLRVEVDDLGDVS
jgi:transaldolase / glucose-6-phosphate isomerase